jgi:HEAT repeat protein
LSSTFSDQDQEARLLQRLGVKSVNEGLWMLEDESLPPSTRSRAARILGQLGGADVEEALLRCLDRPATRSAARAALRALFRREQTEAQLLLAERYRQWTQELGTCLPTELARIAANSDESHDRRSKACSILGGWRCWEGLPALLGILETGEPDLARAASHAVAEIGSRQATRRLLAVIRSAAPLVVRDAALVAVRLLHDRRAVPLLVRLLGDREEPLSLRIHAADALGDLRPTAVITRALLAAADAPEPALRRAALQALHPDPANPRMVATLHALAHDHARVDSQGTVADAASDILAHLSARAHSAR